jgi:hypothetical protein
MAGWIRHWRCGLCRGKNASWVAGSWMQFHMLLESPTCEDDALAVWL